MSNKPDLQNPLSALDIVKLRELQSKLPALKAAIDKAKSAGLDTSVAEETYRQHEQQIKKLLSVYGSPY